MNQHFRTVQSHAGQDAGARRRAAADDDARSRLRHAAGAEAVRHAARGPTRHGGPSSPPSPQAAADFMAQFGIFTEPDPANRGRHHAQPAHRHHRRRRPPRDRTHGQRLDARPNSLPTSPRLPLPRTDPAAPPPLPLTAAERRLVARLRTPAAVQHWLNHLPYNTETGGETLRSFRGVVRTGTRALPRGGALGGHDPRAARLSAARPQLRVDRPARPRDLRLPHGHRMGIRRALARPGPARTASRCFATPRALALSYFEGYIDFTGRVKAYAVVDLRVLGDYDWRLSPKNVWKVEQLLLDWPHRQDRVVERPDRSDAAALRGVPRGARLQAVEVLLGPRALGAAAAGIRADAADQSSDRSRAWGA